VPPYSIAPIADRPPKEAAMPDYEYLKVTRDGAVAVCRA